MVIAARLTLLSAGDHAAELSPAIRRPTAGAVWPAGPRPLSPADALSAAAGLLPAAPEADQLVGDRLTHLRSPRRHPDQRGLRHRRAQQSQAGQGGRGLAIAGLALSGFWVLVAVAAVIFYFVIGKGTVTATDVKVGDCLKEIPSSTRVLTVDTVGCDQMHAGEVFAVLMMPDGD